MQSRNRPGWGFWLVLVLLLPFCGVAQAQELEGSWKLIMRKLPDGTTQLPPAVQGAATWHSGLRNLVVFWPTPDGKPAFASSISNYKMSGTEYTETLLFGVVNDGIGKAPAYNMTPETKIAPITREGGRIAFKLPFDPPSVVLEGDKFTATAEGQFVDFWERAR